MKTKLILSLLLLIITTLIGCRAKPQKIQTQYDKPLLPGQQALQKITDPDKIPDFTLAAFQLKDLKTSVARSLNYLSKPSSKNYFPSCGITHEHAVQSLKTFDELLSSGLIGKSLADAITQKFDVYMSVGCDDQGTVLFTGYYTPLFDASTAPTQTFRYPLYQPPDDLVKTADGTVLGRRNPDGSITPLPPRRVIESTQMLKGKELVWLADPFEAYVTHVQGSAKLKLPDGQILGVGYAANNGREYTSIAQHMINDGLISRSQLSLSAMLKYFKTRKQLAQQYINKNNRFIFFRKENGPPRGSLNEPVTTLRTIATDKSIFPRASVVYIETTLPQAAGASISNRIYNGFALDQDTGGAIKAPGRCDLYMGEGEQAGLLAGKIYEEGKLYYLFLKPRQMAAGK